MKSPFDSPFSGFRSPFAYGRRRGLTLAALFANGEAGDEWLMERDHLYTKTAGGVYEPVTTTGDLVARATGLHNGVNADQDDPNKRPAYDEGGGLSWVDFDGVNDFMQTPSIDFTGSQSVDVVIGALKESTGTAILLELSNNSNNNAGTFRLTAPNSTTNRYGASSKGDGALAAAKANTPEFDAPDRRVLTGRFDIASPQSLLRIDGTDIDESTADQGAGDFGIYPIYIGARGGSSLFFKGKVFSITVVAPRKSSNEVYKTEYYVARKSGVTVPNTFSLTELRSDGVTANGPDGIDQKDIYGDGTIAVLAGKEDGTIDWLEITSPTEFNEYSINTTPRGTKEEGACWADVEGNGQFIAITVDQTEGRVSAYKPTIRADYKGNWDSPSVLATGLSNAQQAWAYDIDSDGQDEIFITYEGEDASSGGVLMLDYDGSGDPDNSANYTSYEIISHPGAWWIIPKADKLIVSARANANSNPNNGVYIYSKPTVPTDVWPLETTVDDSDLDWTQITEGDFFGNGNEDIAAIISNSNDSSVKFFDFSNSWAKTEVVFGNCRWNVKAIPGNKINGRDSLFVAGDGELEYWAWSGSQWIKRAQYIFDGFKTDDRVPFFTVNGHLCAYLPDSENDADYIWLISR